VLSSTSFKTSSSRLELDRRRRRSSACDDDDDDDFFDIYK
jgi:hypothetical protein